MLQAMSVFLNFSVYLLLFTIFVQVFKMAFIYDIDFMTVSLGKQFSQFSIAF